MGSTRQARGGRRGAENPVRALARPLRSIDERLTLPPRLAALSGATFLAFSGIFYRFSGASPSTATVFRCLYALPFLAFLGRNEGRDHGARSARGRALALAAGVFFAFDLLFWQHSIEQVGAGLATVLANLQVVVVAIVGWLLLGERPSGRLLAALPLAVGGTVLISGVLEDGAYGDNPLLGVGFGLAAAVSYAGYLLLIRRANPGGRYPWSSLLDASASAAASAAVVGLAVGDLVLTPAWPAHGWLFLVAITSQVVGYGLVNFALPHLPAAVTSLLLLIQPVVTVAAAALLLAEAPSPLQLAGVALILGGVLLAAAPRRASGDQPGWSGSSATA
jgi:drug/metabolite transporter (DMT)-like permease